MIVCVCKVVSDKLIRRAAGEGVLTLRELSRETGLGTCCGKCVPYAREVLDEALAARGSHAGMPLGALALTAASA